MDTADSNIYLFFSLQNLMFVYGQWKENLVIVFINDCMYVYDVYATMYAYWHMCGVCMHVCALKVESITILLPYPL